MTDHTRSSTNPLWPCHGRDSEGGQRCSAPARHATVRGDTTHLTCPVHASADLDTIELLDPAIPLAGDTWLIATATPAGSQRDHMLIAWQEARDDTDQTTAGCTWFDPEDPAAAPRQWPSFDAYYEVLCDPAELDCDNSGGAQAAAAEVRGYLRKLNPDPSATRVFRCRWREEYDSIDGDQPEHGWALIVPVTVRAAFSSPDITGSHPLWAVSAEAIVEANSWTGAEHGWEFGCGHLLTIVEAGEAPELSLLPLESP